MPLPPTREANVAHLCGYTTATWSNFSHPVAGLLSGEGDLAVIGLALWPRWGWRATPGTTRTGSRAVNRGGGRVAIARALCDAPRGGALDEFASALDPERPPRQLFDDSGDERTRTFQRKATGKMSVHAGSPTYKEAAELVSALVGLESINPGLHPAGSGEGRVATFIAEWLHVRGLDVGDR